MHWLSLFLILAATPAAPSAALDASATTPSAPAVSPADLLTAPLAERWPDATPIYQYGFETEFDDLDDWPIGWTRKTGTGYPRYLPIRVRKEPTPVGHRVLRIQVDGGGAVCSSPLQPADSEHTYVVELQIKTEKVQHDRAWVSLTFFDANEQPLDTFAGDRLITTGRWQKVRLGPIACRKPGARSISVGLHLESIDGQHDLSSAALFDDVWLARLPLVTIECPQPFNLFDLGDSVGVRVRRTGEERREPPALKLTLVDRHGQLARAEARPETVLPADLTELSWRVKPELPGYYEAHTEWRGATGFIHRTSLPVAVMEGATATAQGDFGWSLSRPDLELAEIVPLLKAAGVGRVKLPIWVDLDDKDQLDQRIALCDQLRRQGITVIGVFDVPPPAIRARMSPHFPPTAARVLETPHEVWLPSIEPIVSRLAWHVRAWQWGADGDRSCVGYDPLAERLLPLKQLLNKVGQDLTLTVPWDWSAGPGMPTNSAGNPIETPWRCLARGPTPALTPDAFSKWMSTREHNQAAPWITLPCTYSHDAATRHKLADIPTTNNLAINNPASPGLTNVKYPSDRDACELVQRMLSAKVHGAATTFVDRPLASNSGLATPAGAPQPLLLAWRTTARHVGSSEYLGQLTLPNGSDNYVFARMGNATIVAWNPMLAKEALYLGDERVKQIDLWGHSTRLRRDGKTQEFNTGPTPCFIVGTDEPVIRWMLSTKLERTHLPAQLGTTQPNVVMLTNTFGRSITGRMKVIPPKGWRSTTDEFELELGPSQQLRVPIEWLIPFNAVTGTQDWRAEFDIEADRSVSFTAYGRVELGGKDVRLELTSRLNERGELIVEQRLFNDTSRTLQMRSDLLAPAHRRHRAIVRVPANSSERTYFRLTEGRELMGQTLWLRSEEVGGNNIISRRFVAGSE